MLTLKIMNDAVTGRDCQKVIDYLLDTHDEIEDGEICHCDICQIIIPLLAYAVPIIDDHRQETLGWIKS